MSAYTFDVQGTSQTLPKEVALACVVQFYEVETGRAVEIGFQRTSRDQLEYIDCRWVRQPWGYPGVPDPMDEKFDLRITPMDIEAGKYRGVVVW